MSTNCAPLLADNVPCSYEAEFIQKLMKDNKKIQKLKLKNLTSRYIDDILSVNNLTLLTGFH